MHRLSRQKKEQVEQFVAITNAPEKLALNCLEAGDWSIEAAVELYFQAAAHAPMTVPATPQTSENALQQLYRHYQDAQSDMILAEGVEQLCHDLQVSPEDPVMLVLSWHFRAATMCEFSKEEFMEGMVSLRCDSIQKLQRKLPGLRAELQDDRKFKEIYIYTYSFALDKGKKCMPQETAIALWRLLFSVKPWPLLDTWCEFLEQHHKRAISRDTWAQLLDFAQAVREDLSNFEDSGTAWPYLLDDFVEYMRNGKTLASP
ncbi:g3506 [Coccomyxa elongata]